MYLKLTRTAIAVLLFAAIGCGGGNTGSGFIPNRYWVGYLLWNATAQIDELHKSRANGTEDRLISDVALNGAQWSKYSPDGTALAYYKPTSSSTAGLFVMNVSNGTASQITQLEWSSIYEFGPIDWRHDGARMLFVKIRGKMSAINPDGTGEQQLTPTASNFVDRNGSWSPDGSRVVCERSEQGGNYYEIWVTDGNGGNPVRIASSEYGYPDWSPDGSRIACVRNTDQLVTINPDGGEEVRHSLPSSVQTLYSPRWSPDGSMISFTAITTDFGPIRFGIVDVVSGKVFWRPGNGSYGNIGWIDQP